MQSTVDDRDAMRACSMGFPRATSVANSEIPALKHWKLGLYSLKGGD